MKGGPSPAYMFFNACHRYMHARGGRDRRETPPCQPCARTLIASKARGAPLPHTMDTSGNHTEEIRSSISGAVVPVQRLWQDRANTIIQVIRGYRSAGICLGRGELAHTQAGVVTYIVQCGALYSP